MSPIRIHIGQVPPMLRTFIDDLLAAEPDIAVVGCSKHGDDPLRLSQQQRAEMVITAQGMDSGSPCLDAIIRQSPSSILSISADGRVASTISMVRTSIPLDAVERGTLAQAIRSVTLHFGENRSATLR